MTADAEDRIRTVLVTGGTGGMGRVTAAKLAADGFNATTVTVDGGLSQWSTEL